MFAPTVADARTAQAESSDWKEEAVQASQAVRAARGWRERAGATGACAA